MSEGGKRASFLRRIVEVLTHQLSSMIPMYMENVLSFVNDKCTDVRKIVIGFIEELRLVGLGIRYLQSLQVYQTYH